MTRLTERDEFGNTDIIGVDSRDLQGNLDFKEFNRVTNALNKLADYEETGLSPDEVEAMKDDFSPAEAAVYLRECMEEDGREKSDGWIPCSERLPEDPPEDEIKLYNVTVEGFPEATALYYVGAKEWKDDFGILYNVIAWQPLPEPYIPEGGKAT